MRQESRQLYEYTLCPARCSNEQYYQKLHIHNNHFHPLFEKKEKKRKEKEYATFADSVYLRRI